MSKIAVIFGTRPELIKLYPIIKELRNTSEEILVVNTGQQLELTNKMNIDFDIEVDLINVTNFDKTSLNERFVTILNFLKDIVTDVDKVVVQGDTLSAMAGALSAYNANVAVYHVEAGLRTYDIQQPFPEESYRRIISNVAYKHFAVTEQNKLNLINEGISEDDIFVSGNTIYDTLKEIVDNNDKTQENSILVTSHRKENQGDFHNKLGSFIKELSEKYECKIYVLKHPNKKVQKDLTSNLKGLRNVELIPPLNYREFIHFLSKMKLVITDSGGIVEEMIELKVPTIIIREKTERQEALNCKHIYIAHDIPKIRNQVDDIMISEIKEVSYKNPYMIYDNASSMIAKLIIEGKE